MKKMDCNIPDLKTKVLISYAFNAQLIWVFVFAYAEMQFSQVAAQMVSFFGEEFSMLIKFYLVEGNLQYSE